MELSTQQQTKRLFQLQEACKNRNIPSVTFS